MHWGMELHLGTTKGRLKVLLYNTLMVKARVRVRVRAGERGGGLNLMALAWHPFIRAHPSSTRCT